MDIETIELTALKLHRTISRTVCTLHSHWLSRHHNAVNAQMVYHMVPNVSGTWC